MTLDHDLSAPDAPLETAMRDALDQLPAPDAAHVTHGNTLALKDGTTSRRVLDALEPARAALERQILADRGVNDHDATALEREAARSVSRLAVIEEGLWQHVRRLGLTSTKGRITAATTKLLAVVDRKLKAASTLGLERKPRAVASLSDLLGHTVETGPAPAVIAATAPEPAQAPACDAPDGTV
jgi:hypothetical protein